MNTSCRTHLFLCQSRIQPHDINKILLNHSHIGQMFSVHRFQLFPFTFFLLLRQCESFDPGGDRGEERKMKVNQCLLRAFSLGEQKLFQDMMRSNRMYALISRSLCLSKSFERGILSNSFSNHASPILRIGPSYQDGFLIASKSHKSDQSFPIQTLTLLASLP